MIDLKNLPNQERDEVVQIFLRSHWIKLVDIFGLSFFLIALPFVLLSVGKMQGVEVTSMPLVGPLLAIFLGIYLIMITMIGMTRFTDYYLDTWIVTTERIINIEQHGLFSRVVSELHLNQIQDVTSETRGVAATFLSYGDVYIQTAGTRERFNFKGINIPDEVKEKITNLIKSDKRRHGDASRRNELSN